MKSTNRVLYLSFIFLLAALFTSVAITTETIDEWAVLEEVGTAVNDAHVASDNAERARVRAENTSPDNPEYETVQAEATASLKVERDAHGKKHKIMDKLKKIARGLPTILLFVDKITDLEQKYMPLLRDMAKKKEQLDYCLRNEGRECLELKKLYKDAVGKLQDGGKPFDKVWKDSSKDILKDYVPPKYNDQNTEPVELQAAKYLLRDPEIPVKSSKLPVVLNVKGLADQRLIKRIDANMNGVEADVLFIPEKEVLLVRPRQQLKDGMVKTVVSFEDKFGRLSESSVKVIKDESDPIVEIKKGFRKFKVAVHDEHGFNKIYVSGTGITLPEENPIVFDKPVKKYTFNVKRKGNAEINVNVSAVRKKVNVDSLLGSINTPFENGLPLFEVMNAPIFENRNKWTEKDIGEGEPLLTGVDIRPEVINFVNIKNNLLELREFLSTVTPSSSGASRYLDSILEWAQERRDGKFNVTFGFSAPGTVDDQVFTMDEYPLTALFTSDTSCGQEINLTREIAETTSIGDNTAGICGVLAVAHSLVHKLGVVKKTWRNVVNGRNWHRDFLDKIWRAAGGDTDEGTTVGEQQDAYEDPDWNNEWEIECESEKETDDFDSVEEWCKKLKKKSDRGRNSDGDDCNLGLRNDDSGHRMNIKTVNWRNNRCEITVYNTGVQGSSGNYDDIPLNPGTQTWTISGDEDEPTIRNTAGTNRAFWNGIGFEEANFYCCDEDPKSGCDGRNFGPGTAFNR
jgi:hypothetical protein